ncbi:hypothetical protein M8C21_015137, partial [Ambrosia artemisiifolia]
MDAETQSSGAPKKGGWVTFPHSIDAAQIANIVNGCMALFPIIGAILADSYFGSFIVISVSSIVSMVGILVLTLTSTLTLLKPTPCEHGPSPCEKPSKAQIGILYMGLALSTMGVAGTRFTLATMGADQFENQKHQRVFLNGHFFTMYAAILVSMVGIVYIQDNVSWGLGYGLSGAANLIGLAAFVLGSRHYRLLKPQGSPFTALACVLVAAFRKRKLLLPLTMEDYCQEPPSEETKLMKSTTNNFKFLNHAALVTQGDMNPDGSIKKPWNLCTLQQVEDLKTLVRISPIWSSGILLHTPVAIQMSLVVVQALAMNRHLGPRFQIPAGTMMVFSTISTSTSLAIIDRFLLPTFHKLTHTSPTLLKRIGIGHVLTISSMALSALVESKRLTMSQTHNLASNSIVPMSVFWMVPQLVVVGVGGAFMFPGQLMFYYQEFPKSIKSTASAMVAVFIGIAFYLGTAVVGLIRKTTDWLPNGINDGRMDNKQHIVAMDAEPQSSGAPKKGGWVTFPFLIATMAGLTIAAGGWSNNIIVYLINEFNIKSIDAAQIANILNGCIALFPIIGAILADSYLGSFIVISVSSLVSMVGILLLTLTSTLAQLKPTPCENGLSTCKGPSKAQIGILYTSLALSTVGVAGTRFTLATMGADQFVNPKHQRVYFNWHFFTMYAAMLVCMVGIVYIQDNVSWGLGYGLSGAANLIGLAAFVLGSRHFLLLKPQGSPFTGLACVLVAAFRKRKALLSLRIEDYCQEPQAGGTKLVGTTPTTSFKFLNHAALVTQGDMNSDGSINKPWNLCTLQQVEDLKTLIRISPIWSTGILLHTPIATQMSLVVLQALAMDRHLGPRFQISAGTMMIFVMISTSLSLVLIDRYLIPTFHKLTRTSPTLLKRIGIGHVLTISSMALSALVESKRLATARTHNLTSNSIVPMSVFWMVPQLVVVGVGEAFMFPGQVMFYYQEFPKAIKSTAAAMVAVFIGIAFYLGTAVVDLIRKTTGWLPDGINDGRMDNSGFDDEPNHLNLKPAKYS